MEKIDQILESLYDRVIEPMEAKEQLLVLFDVSNSVCLHEPQYQSYNSKTKLQICDKCGAITN